MPEKISRQTFGLARNRYNSGSPLYFVRQGSGAVPDDAVQGGSVPEKISRQTFVLARNRYNSGSPLYFVRGGSEIIASDAVQSGSMPEILLMLYRILIYRNRTKYRNRTNIKNITHERRKLYDTG